MGILCLFGHKWNGGCVCARCGKEKHDTIVGCHCFDCGKEFHTFKLVDTTHQNDSENSFRWKERLYRCEHCGVERLEAEPYAFV